MQAGPSQPAGSGGSSHLDRKALRSSIDEIRRQAREQLKEYRRARVEAATSTAQAAEATTASASTAESTHQPAVKRDQTPRAAAAAPPVAEQGEHAGEQPEDDGMQPVEGGALARDDERIPRTPTTRMFHPNHQGSAPVEGAELTPEEEEREIGRAKAAAGAGRKPAPAKAASKSRPPAEDGDTPEEPAKAKAAPAKEDGEESVAQRVIAFLKEHRNGVRLTEIEARFGLARIKSARLTNRLIDEGKVEKRDRTYFAP